MLDVGCGGGILSDSMARKGAQVTGIDLSVKALRDVRYEDLLGREEVRLDEAGIKGYITNLEGVSAQFVIDAYHRVYGYPTMSIVDGAAVSANLGVNPSLSITAQAERAMAMWPNKGETDPRPELGEQYRRIQPVRPVRPTVPEAAPGALRLPITPIDPAVPTAP